VYQEIDNMTLLQKVMDDYLEDFNAMTNKPMSLVLFQNAIEHVARISRIISQPYGNALLVRRPTSLPTPALLPDPRCV
jgi:dynein heavy chain, axonemal